MKWEQDLVRDIRFHDERDDIDSPEATGDLFPYIPREFSDCNSSYLSHLFDVTTISTILEIGVHRNGDESSTSVIHSKMGNSLYLGVDLDDKSYLESENIHTIRCDSSDYQMVSDKMSSIGMTSIDLLFIDGWHSINQVLRDWEYTKLLSHEGIVFFHDTTRHPGPKLFLENLNKDKWAVVENFCPDDHGIGTCYVKA